MSGSVAAMQEKKDLSVGVVGRVTTNEPVAVRMQLVGNGVLTVTSVVVTAATDLTVTWSDASTNIYLFSAYTTVGALVDAINATGYFRAKVLDCLRAQRIDSSQLADATVSVSYSHGHANYDIVIDTSVAFMLGYRISPNRDDVLGKNQEAHRTHLQEIKYWANVSGASADSVQVWDCVGTEEDKILSLTSADSTTTTITFGSTLFIDSRLTSLSNNHELVVIVKDAGSLADGGYLRVTGEIE